nr:ABC transporter ATP-binding protein [Sedimentibacter acidaminivorans]
MVLKNINLEIRDGELYTLLGPSGCGKTTILKIIAGFLKPTNGRIFLGEQDITDLPPEKRNIGTVFQNYALFPHMSVEENVLYGLKLKKLSRKLMDEKAKEYLDLVSMYEYRKRKIPELSGGQQQRVALARSLAIEPKVLLLDEPMSNLDAALRDKTREEIHILQQKLKITTLFITHDQKEALSISDTVAVLRNGECLQIGTPREIYMRPTNQFLANFIGESNVFTQSEINTFGINQNISGREEIFIRPEMIKMNVKKSDIFSIQGEIRNTIFNGSTIEYDLIVFNKLVKVLELNTGENLEKKQPNCIVYLSFPKN